jgi:acyl carrier protein
MQKYLKRLSPLIINHFNKPFNFTTKLPIFKLNKFYFSTQTPNQSNGGLTPEEKRDIDYIESGVFELLKSMPKCKPEKLTRTASLEDLGFDSLDIVELVIAVEEKFNLTISGTEQFISR